MCCTDAGGHIYYGIQPNYPGRGIATVRGLPYNQEYRDRFRVSFSRLIVDRINPPIASGTVTIHFWPVIDRLSKQPVDDCFILGMLLCTCVLALLEYVTVLMLTSQQLVLSFYDQIVIIIIIIAKTYKAPLTGAQRRRTVHAYT